MAKKPILVIMAAGMGSRYGGLKQIDPVGPSGEAILDYSLYDARRAGFETVVFIIKHEIEQPFKEAVGARALRAGLEVRYAYHYPPPRGARSQNAVQRVHCLRPKFGEPSLLFERIVAVYLRLKRGETFYPRLAKVCQRTAVETIERQHDGARAVFARKHFESAFPLVVFDPIARVDALRPVRDAEEVVRDRDRRAPNAHADVMPVYLSCAIGLSQMRSAYLTSVAV